MWCRRRVERGIDVTNRVDVKKLCATKADDDAERQLVHTLALSLYRFVVSKTSGAEYVCPLSSRTALLTNARPAQAVMICRNN